MIVPKLSIRAFSNDQYHLDKVFYSNHYKLKSHKGEDGPVILDIGAHCGYFAFTAISLGAKKIYCFEPYPDNYKMLLSNIDDMFSEKIFPFQLGIYTERATLSLSHPKLLEGTYYNFADLDLYDDESDIKTFHITLDEVLGGVIKEYIDILKINIGYAELDILFQSKLLATRVSNIVLETSEDEESVKQFLFKMEERGFVESAVSKDNDKFVIILSKDKIENNFNIKI